MTSVLAVHQHSRYCPVCAGQKRISVRWTGPHGAGSRYRDLVSRLTVERPCPQCAYGSWLLSDGAS